MKILYAIQGTGNGHLARAEEVIPHLKQYGQLHLFVSGAQADITLSHPVKYTSKGLSFYFGKRGGVDFLNTFNKNSTQRVYKEIKKFPVEDYDVVINDFEPITAWACRKKGVPCIGLSHQSALWSNKVPVPKTVDPFGEWIMRKYAPVSQFVGFHFERYDRCIFTPVIRKEVREMKPTQKEHFTVYLPAYDDEKLVRLLSTIPHTRWEIFSKRAKKPYHVDKVSVFPVNKEKFVESMLSSKGILCGAGFETPAEALFLGKKLMVVPMKSQIEQHYNAEALKGLGVSVIKKVKRKHLDKIQHWIDSSHQLEMDYPDITSEAVQQAIGFLK